LLDPKLYNFQDLQTTQLPNPEGDRAFDANAIDPAGEQPIEFIGASNPAQRAWGL
jgi:hypothetical protein